MGTITIVDIPNKTVNLHTLFVLVVCVVFGVMNIFTGSPIIGAGIVVIGLLVVGITRLFKKKMSNSTKGNVLSILQLLLIIVAASLRQELHGMFPLMIGSMAVSAVYYSKKILLTQWIIMDAASVLGIFLRDYIYGGASFDFLIKGILGINASAFLIMFLVNNCLKQLDKVNYAKRESDALVTQVQEQMDEAEVMSEKQLKVVERIADISEDVNMTSGKMLEVSQELKISADEQMDAITQISQEISSITNQTENSLAESDTASQMAQKSSQLLNEGNEEITSLVAAMGKIQESSSKIQTIVKTIQDISFQTNILALNASVEAAKAGEAGKGFAVVAEEVRTLAQKTSESVKNTAALINASMTAVEEGKTIAGTVMKTMEGVIEASNESATHSELISGLTRSQAESLALVRERMNLINETVARTSNASDESAMIAEQVAEEAKKMEQIVRDYRRTE